MNQRIFAGQLKIAFTAATRAAVSSWNSRTMAGYFAPAALTAAMFSRLTPPMATSGRRPPPRCGAVPPVRPQVTFLDRRGEYRPDAQVVGALALGLEGLSQGGTGHPHQQVRRQQGAGLGDGNIILAEVDAVGFAQDGDVELVVDDEQCAASRQKPRISRAVSSRCAAGASFSRYWTMRAPPRQASRATCRWSLLVTT